MSKQTYCPLPSMAIHDAAPSSYSPCCHIDDTSFRKYDSVQDYLKSDELESLKHNLANGVKDPRCNHCWKAEELGISSLRQDSNKDFRFVDSVGGIQQVHLQTGHLCNISCMMCSPGVSSNLSQLWKTKSLHEYHKWWRGPKLEYRQDLEDLIKQNLNTVKAIDVSGGEPLYGKKFLNLIDHIIEKNMHKKISLYITSNGTQLNDRLCKKLLKFKKVVIMTSIDGIGAVNDYIRWGSNFKEVEKNFIKITKLFDYTIATCVSALNVHRYHEIKDFAKYHNAHIEHVMVKDIPAIDPWNCPEELKSTVSDEHREIVSRQGNKGLLKKYIRLWDEQRGIKITDYMPEFEVIIK